MCSQNQVLFHLFRPFFSSSAIDEEDEILKHDELDEIETRLQKFEMGKQKRVKKLKKSMLCFLREKIQMRNDRMERWFFIINAFL